MLEWLPKFILYQEPKKHLLVLVRFISDVFFLVRFQYAQAYLHWPYNAATGEIPAEPPCASHRRRHAYPGTQHNFVQHTKEQQLETSTQDSRS
jgi:hypothetical protein